MTDSLHKGNYSGLEYFKNGSLETDKADIGGRTRQEIITNNHRHGTGSPGQFRSRAYSLHVNRNPMRGSVKEKKRGNRRNSFSVHETSTSNGLEDIDLKCFTGVQADDIAHCLFEASQKGKMDYCNDDDNFRNRRARSFRERPERSGENLRRVRSFKTTSKGLVNRGDSFKSKRTQHSSETPAEVLGDSDHSSESDKTSCVIPKVTMTKTDEQSRYFRVLTLGAEGVGKSSIIDQFMTSEFLGNGSFNVSQSEEEHKVTLQVDGEESTLEFLQAEDFEEKVENLALDGFLVVYSINERHTFDVAVEILKQLREEVGASKAIILVGNKADLVRTRTIGADEGRHAADGYGCKYIETSAALDMNVDDLLVGMYKQITLKGDSHCGTEELNPPTTKVKQRKSSFKRTKRFLEKIFLGGGSKEKTTTENLYVD